MGFQLLPHKFIRSMDTRLDSDQGCPNLNQERVLAGPQAKPESEEFCGDQPERAPDSDLDSLDRYPIWCPCCG